MVNEYVDRLAQNIVRHSDAKVPFVVRVVDTDDVNAFALPGGYFFVNKGLLLEADTEAELAGVMAHEIAHVTARHATERMTKGQLLQFAALPALFIGGYWTQVAIRQGLGLGLSLSVLESHGNPKEKPISWALSISGIRGLTRADSSPFSRNWRPKRRISRGSLPVSSGPIRP